MMGKCSKYVSRKFEGSFKEVSKVFQGSFMGVLRNIDQRFQFRLKGVLRLSKRGLKSVSTVLKGCFKNFHFMGVSWVFKLCFILLNGVKQVVSRMCLERF